MEVMEPYQLPNDEDVRRALQQGEKAVVELVRQLTDNSSSWQLDCKPWKIGWRRTAATVVSRPPVTDTTNLHPRACVNGTKGKVEGSRVI
jgi:hypothetical protein